jgi:peptidoglycan/xylan/chitin deacetylase (PgdA/CDA1 family)
MSHATLSVEPAHRAPVVDGDARPSPLRQLVKGLAIALPRRALLLHGPRSSRSVCLTFDDGPHPEYTPRLLEALAAHDVRATFFVVGERAERHPEIVARIAREGHVVGHHSYAHSLPEHTSARQLFEEARRTARLLEKITGEAPRLFRPPHGTLTAAKLVGLWALRQTVVLWSQDPKDFACGAPADVHRAFRARPPVGGDIVLLHDTWEHTATLAGEMIRNIRRRGLALDTVTAWL